ncbi:MAG: tryptophan 2,3-dioxygenase family protein [Planctomycetota bacterium]
MTSNRPANYWDYIRVEDLLGLQQGLEADESKLANEEVMFITVHQVFELWFKLVLREIRSARDLVMAEHVAEPELARLVHSLRRVSTILRVSIPHWEVMETMSTREFLGFRDKLIPASGFQSAQLRQIEILLGLPEDERISLGVDRTYRDALRGHDGSESSASRRVTAQLADGPSLREAIDRWLARTPLDGVPFDHRDAPAQLQRFVTAFTKAHAIEVDSACARASSIAQSTEDRAKLQARFDAEKQWLVDFLSPSAADGGAARQRVRAAMLFIETYRELPLLAWPGEVLDTLVELEELFVIFRQRHARMVERIIGKRTGTGGSPGVDYLDQTALKYRIFRDLCAIRTIQIRREAAPALERPQFYEFKNG